MNRLIKILLVDDSEFDRQKIIRAMQKDNSTSYEFQELDEGEKLEQVALEWRPDLVILDYSLPGMNGIARLKHIFTKLGKIPFPFIMATGTGDEPTAVEAMKLGALDYVSKEGFQSDIIRQVVNRALEKNELKQTLLIQQDKLQEYVNELQNERELRERFVNTLTHDLRNPLAAAKMATQLILKTTEDPQKVINLVGRIQKSLSRAEYMISDLLDANRIKAGQQLPLEIAPLQ